MKPAPAKKHYTIQTIGNDKVNQLRHARYFKNLDGLKEHMKKHADFMRPKFEATLKVLEEELTDLESVHGSSLSADTSYHLMLWRAVQRL